MKQDREMCARTIQSARSWLRYVEASKCENRLDLILRALKELQAVRRLARNVYFPEKGV